MTLTLELPSETARTLVSAAQECGENLESFALGILTKNMIVRDLSFREHFADLHDSVRASGLKDDDIDQLIDTAIAESRSLR